MSPTRRLGSLPAPVLEEMVGAAHSLGVNPRLAVALALTEGSPSYGQAFNESELDLLTNQRYVAERALRHLRERASAVGGDLMRQIQAYNGLGILPPGYYGRTRPINAARDLPYGQRVLDVQRNVVQHSPETLRAPFLAPAVSALAGEDWRAAEEIARDLDIQRRNPWLLRED